MIRHLAEQKSCLFVGRCADYILRDFPRCANIFVSASPEARIERLMKLHNISAEKAEELMEKADKKRSSYYNYYSYKTWGATEPMMPNNKLFTLDNYLATPHMAWYSEEAALELKRKVAEECVSFLKEHTVRYPINHLK